MLDIELDSLEYSYANDSEQKIILPITLNWAKQISNNSNSSNIQTRIGSLQEASSASLRYTTPPETPPSGTSYSSAIIKMEQLSPIAPGPVSPGNNDLPYKLLQSEHSQHHGPHHATAMAAVHHHQAQLQTYPPMYGANSFLTGASSCGNSNSSSGAGPPMLLTPPSPSSFINEAFVQSSDRMHQPSHPPWLSRGQNQIAALSDIISDWPQSSPSGAQLAGTNGSFGTLQSYPTASAAMMPSFQNAYGVQNSYHHHHHHAYYSNPFNPFNQGPGTATFTQFSETCPYPMANMSTAISASSPSSIPSAATAAVSTFINASPGSTQTSTSPSDVDNGGNTFETTSLVTGYSTEGNSIGTPLHLTSTFSPMETKSTSNVSNSMNSCSKGRNKGGGDGTKFDWMKKSNHSSSMSNSGKTRTKDKYRVVYSETQRLELEKEFHFSRYITIKRKTELAMQLQLSERQVKIWFQNRRAKERKQTKKNEELAKKEKNKETSSAMLSGSSNLTSNSKGSAPLSMVNHSNNDSQPTRTVQHRPTSHLHVSQPITPIAASKFTPKIEILSPPMTSHDVTNIHQHLQHQTNQQHQPSGALLPMTGSVNENNNENNGYLSLNADDHLLLRTSFTSSLMKQTSTLSNDSSSRFNLVNTSESQIAPLHLASAS